MSEEPTIPVAAGKSADTGQNKIKVLLAEDDKFISRAYKDGLGRAGLDVITAFDGNEALAAIRNNRPDIILLDLIMPGRNGFEVLEELHNDNSLNDIPVLILSNLGQDTDIQKGRSLGAVDYMVKANFTMAEVLEKINKYLKK